ncbi:PKD domain-containing protein [archaeon]|nr:PKD domain-containing protein [archaeon]
MKKIFLFLALTFILSSFASAQVNEYNYFKLGELDSNTNLIKTSTPVSGVNVRGFICSDSGCSGTLGNLWGGELYTSTSGMNLVYPTYLQSVYGYGFWVYKNGYVPYWVKGVTWYGTGTVPAVNRYLAKKQVCISAVSIVDTSQTGRDLSVDVRVNSPIVKKYGSMYVPTEIRSHLNTLTDVYAEVRDDGGSLIWSNSRQANLHYSGNTIESFSVNNLKDGNYTFTVSTSSGNEPKCLSYNPDSDSFDFEIYVDLFPSVSASADPLSGTFPLDVSFSCQGTGGNGILTYFWEFGNGDTSALQNPEYTYLYAGDFDASCRVRDEDGDEAFDYVTIEVGTPEQELKITNLVCLDEVIEGHNQSCSISVEDSLGDVTIEVFYSDDSPFGTCLTDGVTGTCGVKDLQNVVGSFEVYAIASKTGYISDDDKEPKFNYNVVAEEYKIVNLKVYNDSNFTNEDYDFFRGENMFVSFGIENSEGEEITTDLISNVTLISSLAGGRVGLERIEKIGNKYYYKLIPIPITHDFLGNETIFVFDIVDSSEIQKEVTLMIRNNLPIISPDIPSQTIEEGDVVYLNLSLYESDVEDSGDDLRWEIMSSGSGVNVSLTGKDLRIEGLDDGDFEIVLRLFDLDDDYDEFVVEVLVEKESTGGGSSGCRNEWECSAWSECENGAMTRTCIDRKYCSKERNKPIEFQSCFDEGAQIYSGAIELGNASFNEKSSSNFLEKLTLGDFIWILVFLILVIMSFLIWILWTRF